MIELAHGSVGRRRTAAALSMLHITTFLSGVTFSLIAPFLPLEAEARRVTALGVGFIFSALPAARLVTTVAVARWLVSGRMFCSGGVCVKWLVVLGTVLLGVGTGCLATVKELRQEEYFWGAAILRGIAGVGAGLVEAGSLELAGALSGYGMGAHLAARAGWQGLGLMAGAPAGGVLFSLWGGSDGALLSCAGAVLLVGFAQVCVLPAPRESGLGMSLNAEVDGNEEGGGGGLSRQAVPLLLSSDRLLVSAGAVLQRPWPAVLLASGGISIAAVAFLGPTLAPHLSPDGVGPLEVGLLLGLASACFALLALAAAAAMATVGHALLILFGLAFEAAGFVLLGPSFPFVPLTLASQVIALVLIGGGAGILTVPVAPGMLADPGVRVLGSGSSETVAALAAAATAIGETAGPLVAGLLAQGVGFGEACFFVAAGLVTLMGVVIATLLAIGQFAYPFCPCRSDTSTSTTTSPERRSLLTNPSSSNRRRSRTASAARPFLPITPGGISLPPIEQHPTPSQPQQLNNRTPPLSPLSSIDDDATSNYTADQGSDGSEAGDIAIV